MKLRSILALLLIAIVADQMIFIQITTAYYQIDSNIHTEYLLQ